MAFTANTPVLASDYSPAGGSLKARITAEASRRSLADPAPTAVFADDPVNASEFNSYRTAIRTTLNNTSYVFTTPDPGAKSVDELIEAVDLALLSASLSELEAEVLSAPSTPPCTPAFSTFGCACNGGEQFTEFGVIVNVLSSFGALSSASYGGSCYRDSCASIQLNGGYHLTYTINDPCGTQTELIPMATGYSIAWVHKQDWFGIYGNAVSPGNECAGCTAVDGTLIFSHGRVTSHWWVYTSPPWYT